MSVSTADFPRYRALWSLAVLLLAACDSPQEPPWRLPTEMEVSRHDTQTAVVGHPLATQVEVRVLDRRRRPVAGAEVEFVATAGEGTLLPPSTRTDAGGVARASWTLGPRAGIQRAEARLPNSRVGPAEFVALGTPDGPARLVKVSGDDQWQVVERALEEPLVVRVTDAYGNAVPAAAVAWSTWRGTLVPEADSTDPSGVVRAAWTLDEFGGVHVATAMLEGRDTVRFRAVAEPEVFSVSIGLEREATLQTGTVSIWATTVGRFGRRPVGPVRSTWTLSDSSVASLDTAFHSPSDGYLVGAVTARNPGTTEISVTVQGHTATTSFRSVGVEGYRVENVRITSGSLNDAGDVAAIEGDRLVVWRNGRITETSLAHLPPGIGLMGVGSTGAVLAYDGGYSWIIRNGTAVQLTDGPAYPYAINDEDVVVGTTGHLGDPLQRVFLWIRGETTLLPHPPDSDGSRTVEPRAINRQRQVAVTTYPRGDYTQTNVRAYVWHEGRYTAIPRPDPACAGWSAHSINNSGTVLVSCGGAEALSFLWDGHTFTSLAPIRGGAAVNDRGEVSQMVWPCRAYLWRAGQGRCLIQDDLGAWDPRLNNRGQILLRGDYVSLAYLLTPDP
jgi:hypothetical protein